MNEKFFALPAQRRQAVINAGYRVFSQNPYKKSPMGEIAAEAGISKSLLFYYFQNKRELYLYLWENCVDTTIRYMNEYGCYEQDDLFEMLYRGMQAKIHILRKYPYMGAFSVRAFYERDPQVHMDIQETYQKYKSYGVHSTLTRLDPEQFIEGLDLSMMYRQMVLATEGYLWEMMQESVDVEKMERDFVEMLGFWKQIYLRKKEDEK